MAKWNARHGPRYTLKWGCGTTIFDDKLPRTALIRRADYIKSGIVPHNIDREQFVSDATSEVVRILGGRPGDYNIVEGA